MHPQHTTRSVLAVCTLAALLGGVPAVSAQSPSHLYLERIPSRYDATALPAFELAPGLEMPDEARRYLMKALSVVSGKAVTALQESPQSASDTAREKGGWHGTLPDDPEVSYVFNPHTRRLDVVNHRLQNLSPEPAAQPALSERQAVTIAMEVVSALHREGVINKEDFDLVDLHIATQKMGHGVVGKPLDRSQEQIVDYRITAKRQLNGVPVVGSFLRIVVHQTGAVSELNLAYRPIKARLRGREQAPLGLGKAVPIDRTPEQAQQAFERAMVRDPHTRLDVERWGLAYVDTGAAAQRFYQPAYVFLVTPLTDTQQGTTAARKVVRVVPASLHMLEELPFDPHPTPPARPPVGDARKLPQS